MEITFKHLALSWVCSWNLHIYYLSHLFGIYFWWITIPRISNSLHTDLIQINCNRKTIVFVESVSAYSLVLILSCLRAQIDQYFMLKESATQTLINQLKKGVDWADHFVVWYPCRLSFFPVCFLSPWPCFVRVFRLDVLL